ncbi:MAG: hypothetical protein V4792_04350 [Pseudomonadota bacterium]
MTETDWAHSFAREMLRLGVRAELDRLITLGLVQHASDGSSDPVRVARREFIQSPPHDD